MRYAAPAAHREVPWEYQAPEGERLIAVPSRVIVNNVESYIACCQAGLGLIQVPRFDVQHLLNSGELVAVMPEFQAGPMTISALYPHRRQRSRRLSAFVDWFAALIQPYLSTKGT